MSGSRRTQRSVRVVSAVLLVLAAAGGVAATVALGTGVEVAAVAAALLSLVAVRILYAEITHTRRTASADRSAQARSFGAAMAVKQAEHTEYTKVMSYRLASRDRTITELEGTVRLAERRADVAEDKVKHEAQRANEAQTRLSDLLDEVLAVQAAAAVAEGAAGVDAEAVSDDVAVPATGLLPADLDAVAAQLADLPTIVDLMAWEDRANVATVDELRKQA